MARILVAMSGGVDSAMAAAALQQMGHEVVGLFMRRKADSGRDEDAPPDSQGCGNAADEHDARRLAERLGIELHAVPFDEPFQQIIDYFIDEYLAARTPNPCIVCNARLKFGELFVHADRLGAEQVATGHYVRLTPPPPGSRFPALRCAFDRSKDQSYALFGIQRDRLSRLVFPCGAWSKSAVRNLARERGLPIAEKPESQDICFVPDQDHPRFIRRRRPGVDTSGRIVTTEGRVVGSHDGFERFTIGQRKGLGVALGQPRFVVRIDADTGDVIIGPRAALARRALTASRANWLIDPPEESFRCEVKIRYRSAAVAAIVTPQAGSRRFHVEMESPCYGVAPGQAAVCYVGDRVVGGGWIDAQASRNG